MSNDIELIRKYISGENLDDELIAKLEDDYVFMTNCIIATSDKKLYNLCSDNVKHNIDFVNFIIKKFRDDEVFIDKVLTNYIGGNKKVNEIDVKVLDIFVDLVSSLKNKGLLLKYKTLLFSIYSHERIVANKIKEDLSLKCEFEVVERLQLGFYIFMMDFKSSDKVLGYFARLFMDEIVATDYVDAEELIHEQFNSFKELNTCGLNKFMVNYISSFDYFLSDYLACNSDIIKSYVGDISLIEKNWNKKELNLKYKKFNLILEKVHNYYIDNNFKFILDEQASIYYVAKKMGIVNKLLEVDDLFKEDGIDFNEYISDVELLIKLEDDSNKTYLNDIKDIINDCLAKKGIKNNNLPKHKIIDISHLRKKYSNK